MSGATTWCVVYNTSSSSQVIDEEGHAIDPGTFACAQRSVVRDLIDREWLIVTDMSDIGPDSRSDARMAKEEAQSRNDAIDAEKAQAAHTETATAKTTAKERSTGTDATTKK